MPLTSPFGEHTQKCEPSWSQTITYYSFTVKYFKELLVKEQLW